jgi:hypothetical protein
MVAYSMGGTQGGVDRVSSCESVHKAAQERIPAPWTWSGRIGGKKGQDGEGVVLASTDRWIGAAQG